MDFKDNKAIYLQIADRLCNEILQEKYTEDARVPSVREYAAEVEVNVNTLMRTYEYLQQQEIIYNKRGIGYFVSPGAKGRIYTSQKENFMTEQLSDFFRQIYVLDIPIEKIVEMYKEYCKQQSNKQ